MCIRDRNMGLTYSGNDTWDRMLQQGIQLLERFAQEGRVQIRRPRSTQQIQFNRTLGSGNSFVGYVDAIGELDGTPCVLEWKTTSARYPEAVSYTHLRAHETVLDLVCRLLLE